MWYTYKKKDFTLPMSKIVLPLPSVPPNSPASGSQRFSLSTGWLTTWGSVIAYCLCIFVLSAQSFLSVPTTVPSADKGAHAILYAGLGYVWARAVQRSWPTQAPGMILVSSFVFTALYGASDEWHQFYVPERLAEVRDVVADTIGGTLGGLGFVVWQRMRDIRRTQA